MIIKDLIPTHNRLRNPGKIKFFSDDYIKPILLSRVDNNFYIHDGHHRLVFEYMRGNMELNDSYFYIQTFSAEEYNSINLKVGYVTPFNIVTECRKPDFFEYKNMVNKMVECLDEEAIKVPAMRHFSVVPMCENAINRFIHETKHMYSEPRAVFTLKDMVIDYMKG